MQVKSILITGDDGYNSIGTRLLAHFLKDDFDVKIAASKSQQTGVGGCINIKGGAYGEALIEDVPTLWVEGSPCDAVDASREQFQQTYDLVVSGINMGANIGNSIISSGTFSAAFRALGLGIAKQAIALSWNCPTSMWTKDHHEEDDLEEFLKYPGEIARQVIDLAIANNNWGAQILNVNFPEKYSNKVRFTRPLQGINDFFFPVKLDEKKRHFYYPGGLVDKPPQDESIDTDALRSGLISISPCRADFLDEKLYQKHQDLNFQL